MITFVAQRITERSLGTYRPAVQHEVVEAPAGRRSTSPTGPEARPRASGTRCFGILGAIAVVVLLTVLPDAPLRNPETGSSSRTRR